MTVLDHLKENLGVSEHTRISGSRTVFSTHVFLSVLQEIMTETGHLGTHTSEVIWEVNSEVNSSHILRSILRSILVISEVNSGPILGPILGNLINTRSIRKLGTF